MTPVTGFLIQTSAPSRVSYSIGIRQFLALAQPGFQRASVRRRLRHAAISGPADPGLTVPGGSVIRFRGRILRLGDLGVWRSAHERAPGFFLAAVQRRRATSVGEKP